MTEREHKLGERHTATLIEEYNVAIAAGEIRADTAAKALIAAACAIGLKACTREEFATMLRIAATGVERGKTSRVN